MLKILLNPNHKIVPFQMKNFSLSLDYNFSQ